MNEGQGWRRRAEIDPGRARPLLLIITDPQNPSETAIISAGRVVSIFPILTRRHLQVDTRSIHLISLTPSLVSNVTMNDSNAGISSVPLKTYN